jgi:hypothetical protein
MIIVSDQLEADMKLVVFGANGQTGRLLTTQAAAGHRVVAVTRQPGDFPLSSSDLAVAGVDVRDEVIGRPLRYQEISPTEAADGMVARGRPLSWPAPITDAADMILGRPDTPTPNGFSITPRHFRNRR